MRQLFIDAIQLSNQIVNCHSYVIDLPVVQNLMGRQKLTFQTPVTLFVGENGTGKSTLIEAIAIAAGFNAEGGTKNFQFSTQDSHSEFHEYITLVRRNYPKDGFFLRAESFYNVATEIERLGGLHNYGFKSLHAQSHGESFLALIQNRFHGQGLYILDEPEAALSPSRQLTLLRCILQLVEQGAQFIIATHSPILLTCPSAQIYELTATDIQEVKYHETEHFRFTKLFMENPERMLKYLLED